jgi:hypothetical protein
MTHPEFRAGIVARSEVLLRAIPDEPINQPRHEVRYNPVYDGQQQVPGGDPK